MGVVLARLQQERRTHNPCNLLKIISTVVNLRVGIWLSNGLHHVTLIEECICKFCGYGGETKDNLSMFGVPRAATACEQG